MAKAKKKNKKKSTKRRAAPANPVKRKTRKKRARRAPMSNPPKRRARRRSRARKNPPGALVSKAGIKQSLGVVAGGIAAVAVTALAQRVIDSPDADKAVALIAPAVVAVTASALVPGQTGMNIAMGAIGVLGAATGAAITDAIQGSALLGQQPAAAAPKTNPPRHRSFRLNPPGPNGYPMSPRLMAPAAAYR